MSSSSPSHTPTWRNARIFVFCAVAVAGMVGVSYAAVPLYDLFCAVTGYGGTVQRASASTGVIDREMGVRFDSNIERGLPLRVDPPDLSTAQMGESRTVVYHATNLSDAPLSTTAGFNVTPQTTGVYFNKIQCFCFTEQTIPPNETVEMPVTYFVDPDLDNDSELDTIHEITLSYTFYAS